MSEIRDQYSKKAERLKGYRYIILLTAGIFIFCLQSCSVTKYSITHGPLKTGEKYATLLIAEHNQPKTVIGIEQIDDKSFRRIYSENQTKRFRLVSGKHRVAYYYFLSKSPGMILFSEDFNISFSVESGHTYTLKNYTQWDNTYPEKFTSVDFLTMITDTTEGEIVAWDSSGTGAFKKEVQRQTGLNFTEETEKRTVKTADVTKKREKAAALCGDEYCEQDESRSSCPADCFPQAVKPADLSKGDRTVFLDFTYKGQKSGIYFVVNRSVHEIIASLPRTLSYEKGKKNITKKDFILQKLNNQMQKDKLLPLAEKIRSLTPDINKQARIAISLVQNIPYGFPDVSDADDDYAEKYPYGVIWDQMGVCSEKSNLLLFLLRELGFGTATFMYEKEDHQAVGIKCPEAYDVDDTGYCFVEITGPKIITDNLSSYTGVGNLTDFTLIHISDGIQLEGVEEEFRDKNLYYDLINKAKANNGVLEKDEYNLYNSILNKYGMD